jgi:hypothetical protein
VAWSNGREKGIYTAEDVKDFIWLMVYTGLRISDAGLFHMNRLKGNEVFPRAKKNGGEVVRLHPRLAPGSADCKGKAVWSSSVRRRAF